MVKSPPTSCVFSLSSRLYTRHLCTQPTTADTKPHSRPRSSSPTHDNTVHCYTSFTATPAAVIQQLPAIADGPTRWTESFPLCYRYPVWQMAELVGQTVASIVNLVQPTTVNRWRTVVSATWKYDDPRLNMSHEGAARVRHVQPCRTNYRVSYVLSSDQLQESWIICKLKSFSPLYLHDLILKTDELHSVCLKRYAILVIKNSFTEE